MTPISEQDVNIIEKQNLCQRVSGFFCSRDDEDDIEMIDPIDTGHTPINQIIKILVVGPGDSGKSTILKQMRVIHGKNYSTDECKKYKPVIIQNIVDSLIRLVDAMNMFNLCFELDENEMKYESFLNFVEPIKSGDLNEWNSKSKEYCDIIQSIWNDPSVKICYERRNLFYLNDSTEYFMKNISKICLPQYVPELDDILRVRQPTTAIQEYKFRISGTYFLFVDVGGQRSERRKWINCFENVTCLLFVASLSDYDLKMGRDELRVSHSNENEEVNRMRDGLDLFRTLINWKKKVYIQPNRTVPKQEVVDVLLFEKVSIILFLNKEDLFEEKFRRSSLKSCFKDYVENKSVEEAKEFIAHKFIECDNTFKSKRNSRDIYWHYTFALDRKCIETVVASVKDRIIKFMLESMRL